MRKIITLIATLLLSIALGSAQEPYTRPLNLEPARWIWYPSSRTPQNTFVLFRKDIEIEQVPHEATGWIVADSRYRLFVNGQRVQWGPAPSDPRWQEADPVDIAPYLHEGSNTIAVEVCFYGSGDGTTPIGKPGLLLSIDLGGEQRLISDTSWRCQLAQSWEPGKYKRWFLRSLQECFDARLYPQGWTEPGYTMDSSWLGAMVVGPGSRPSISNGYRDYQWESRNNSRVAQLRERSVPMLKETCIEGPTLRETMLIDWKVPAENFFDMAMSAESAYSVTDRQIVSDCADSYVINPTQAGESVSYVFAFDEQAVGFPYFTIDAPEGTVVEMLVHEAHEPGGDAVMNTHFHSWSRFVCREGVNHFETFDFESYRWVQFIIRDFDRPVTLSGVGMRRRTYPWSIYPEIKVQDDTLQRVLEADINTLNNCALETLVDGMARERQQYSGDGGHQIHALYQFFRPDSLLTRYINTFSQGSTIEGFFMDSWPGWDRMVRVFERELQLTAWGPILDHGIGFCFDVYNYYMYTGNTQSLQEVFPRLVKFYHYMTSLTSPEDGLIPSVDLGMCSVYMDQKAYRNDREKQLALNLYVAAMCKYAMAPLCEVFGEPELRDEVYAYGEAVQSACVAKYWDPQQKVFVNNLPWRDSEGGEDRYCDRSLSTALLYDMCPDGEYQQCLNILATRPDNLGQSYPCNLVWPMWALIKYHRMDVVLQDLRTKWGSMRSVWENNTLEEFFGAEPDNTAEWSHSAVMPLIAMSQGIAGIVPLKSDGSLIKIEPQPCDLTGAEFDVWTQRGPVHFRAQTSKRGRRSISLDIPECVQAELWLPEQCRTKLPLLRTESGGIKVYLAEGSVTLDL